MKVFVVNCGSSSIKYQLFDMDNEVVLAKGMLERLGSESPLLHNYCNKKSIDLPVDAQDHASGLLRILNVLMDECSGVLESIDEIDGVGHRVVHGGEEITASARIDARVIEIIQRNCTLAPLHNPPNLEGIEAAMAVMPDATHVAVFDTAFLATMPARAYRYAVPGDWYTKHHVRRYGFHGSSHRYVTLRMTEFMGKAPEDVNLITAHLGNGCSITAVEGGRAVDHSMGMTPLGGLVMGTRSGDIDPAVVLHMVSTGLNPMQINQMLNKNSGLLGISELSNDMRDLLEAAGKGDERALLAVDMFVYRIVKYVGAYHAILPRVDALVLTGGIGENSLPIRSRICDLLAPLGIKCDPIRNRATVGGKAGLISADGSAFPVWVMPTNEELMIARDTVSIMAT